MTQASARRVRVAATPATFALPLISIFKALSSISGMRDFDKV